MPIKLSELNWEWVCVWVRVSECMRAWVRVSVREERVSERVVWCVGGVCVCVSEWGGERSMRESMRVGGVWGVCVWCVCVWERESRCVVCGCGGVCGCVLCVRVSEWWWERSGERASEAWASECMRGECDVVRCERVSERVREWVCVSECVWEGVWVCVECVCVWETVVWVCVSGGCERGCMRVRVRAGCAWVRVWERGCMSVCVWWCVCVWCVVCQVTLFYIALLTIQM